MFIGHFAVALAAKRVSPSTSLGVLFAATQLPDLLWAALLLAGVEHAEIASGPDTRIPLRFTHYPYSHSFLAVLVLSIVAGLLWRRRTGLARAAWLVGALVMSHWLLDWLVHVPDLQLAPGSETRVGLGLWQWPRASLGLELTLFAAGAAVYLKSCTATDRIGQWSLWTLLAFLVVVQMANALGPAPTDVTAVAWSTFAIWLLVIWAAWADGHRHVNPRP